MTFKGNVYSIVNIYAPTDSKYRKLFFKSTKKWILEKTENKNCLIICGDLNCTLSDVDRKTQNYDSSRPFFKDFITSLDVHDTYRRYNGEKQCFTYANKDRTIQSRIDYIFMSGYLLSLVKKVYVETAPKAPDHKAVLCTLRHDIDIGNSY